MTVLAGETAVMHFSSPRQCEITAGNSWEQNRREELMAVSLQSCCQPSLGPLCPQTHLSFQEKQEQEWRMVSWKAPKADPCHSATIKRARNVSVLSVTIFRQFLPTSKPIITELGLLSLSTLAVSVSKPLSTNQWQANWPPFPWQAPHVESFTLGS